MAQITDPESIRITTKKGSGESKGSCLGITKNFFTICFLKLYDTFSDVAVAYNMFYGEEEHPLTGAACVIFIVLPTLIRTCYSCCSIDSMKKHEQNYAAIIWLANLLNLNPIWDFYAATKWPEDKEEIEQGNRSFSFYTNAIDALFESAPQFLVQTGFVLVTFDFTALREEGFVAVTDEVKMLFSSIIFSMLSVTFAVSSLVVHLLKKDSVNGGIRFFAFIFSVCFTAMTLTSVATFIAAYGPWVCLAIPLWLLCCIAPAFQVGPMAACFIVPLHIGGTYLLFYMSLYSSWSRLAENDGQKVIQDVLIDQYGADAVLMVASITEAVALFLMGAGACCEM